MLWAQNRVHIAKAALALAGAVVLAWGLAVTVADLPWQAIAYGRRIAPILRGFSTGFDDQVKLLFVGEGMDSSVVIDQRGDQRSFFVSGKSEASSAPLDMRLQRMMGHVPALLHWLAQVRVGGRVRSGHYGRVVCSVSRSAKHCD